MTLLLLFAVLAPLVSFGFTDNFIPFVNAQNPDICGDHLCATGEKKQLPKAFSITPENDDPENLDKDTHLLFVQTATAGTFIQKDGRNILTLVDVSPSTVWFSDRPHRITGHEGTDIFVAKWAEGKNSFADNPPNAALDISDSIKSTDVIIVELTNPVYSPESQTLQYDVIILQEATEGLTHYAKDADATIPTRFSKVALFIDDEDLDSVLTPNAIPIPGISQFYGVDITKGISKDNLVPIALFDFDSDNTIEVQIGDNNYLVPESLVLDATDNYDLKSHVYTSVKELSKSLSVSAGISYSSPTVDAEVDASYSQDSSTSESSYFATVDAYDRKYGLTAETGLEATDRFSNAVDNLPLQYIGNQDEYFEFFSTFGTHYTHSVEYGGIMHYWSQQSDTSSMSAQEFEVSVSASVNEMAGSVSADVDVSGSTSESESSSNVNVSITGSGGDSSLLGSYLTQRSPDSFNDWWASIDDNPGQMNIRYNEIYNLVTDYHKKSQLQNALSDYLRSDFGYQVLVANDKQHFLTTISIGTDNSNTLIFDFPQEDKRDSKQFEDHVSFGGMLVVNNLQTGELVEKFVVNEYPPTSNNGLPQLVTDDTIPKISDRIEHYEQQGDGYLYFVTMFTHFDTDDQSDFLWFQKVGAQSFVDIPKGANYYVLVGHSDLGQGLGKSMISNVGDENWTVPILYTTSSGVSLSQLQSQAQQFAKLTGYASSLNGHDQISCEFSGGIIKTTEGFSAINTPTTDECS